MASAERSVAELYAAARTGERRALGRLLTIVEAGGGQADELSELANPHTGDAHVVGITGAPGSGKSTLVGRLVGDLVAAGRAPAVLAVDPSSPLTGGAILGDRIRMDDVVDPHGTADAAFIRSMATRGHSGGLALAVPLALRLFGAVGYDPVIVETVGVGQVEVDVVGAADTAVVVMNPGMGDAVQANKAGLLEVADIFVVNKSDQPGASDVRRNLELMLDLSHLTGQESDSGYRPPIVMASALNGEGTSDVWATIDTHLTHLDETGQRASRRRSRTRAEVRARLDETMATVIEATMGSAAGAEWLRKADTGAVSPNHASAALLEQILEQRQP